MRQWWGSMRESPTSSPLPLASTTGPSRESSPNVTSATRRSAAARPNWRVRCPRRVTERSLYRDHPGAQIALERLNVATMRFKARRMNAYLYASNLAHVPKQLAWGAAKRGMRVTPVKSAYSSQECLQCHFVAKSNRPEQQPFCCGVCGWERHADHNAAGA